MAEPRPHRPARALSGMLSGLDEVDSPPDYPRPADTLEARQQRRQAARLLTKDADPSPTLLAELADFYPTTPLRSSPSPAASTPSTPVRTSPRINSPRSAQQTPSGTLNKTVRRAQAKRTAQQSSSPSKPEGFRRSSKRQKVSFAVEKGRSQSAQLALIITQAWAIGREEADL